MEHTETKRSEIMLFTDLFDRKRAANMDVPYYLDTFIPMKAAQWRVRPKWLDFPGLKMSGSEAVLPHHWAPKSKHTRNSPSSSVCNFSRAGYF